MQKSICNVFQNTSLKFLNFYVTFPSHNQPSPSRRGTEMFLQFRKTLYTHKK